jgi:hypothetical protein
LVFIAISTSLGSWASHLVLIFFPICFQEVLDEDVCHVDALSRLKDFQVAFGIVF